MNFQTIADYRVSRISCGCMRLGELDFSKADAFVRTAVERGINFFDHADIYGGGECERLFGRILKNQPSLRDSMILQTKCGIRHGLYDFSKHHIMKCVEESLQRLGTECLDFLLLHRPDTLYDSTEIAEAFSTLKAQGKVRRFGVSNCNPLQIQLLEKDTGETMYINQMQLSLGHTVMLDTAFNVNTRMSEAVDRDGHTLDYCRLHDITIQAWSPLQNSVTGRPFVGDAGLPRLNATLERIATDRGITPTGLAVAWLLRHPARIQPVIGTVSVDRLNEICDASDTVISREEWYELYTSTEKPAP